jgi:hypothetical protein
MTKRPLTHTVYAQRFEHGKFIKWVATGAAYFEQAADGKFAAHVFTDSIVRGDNGYLCIMPGGVEPPAPEPERS